MKLENRLKEIQIALKIADRFRAIEGFDTNFPYAAGETREF